MERLYGTIGEEKKSEIFKYNIQKFKKDLAISITGMFGFGGDYNGNTGRLLTPLSKNNSSLQIEFNQPITLPNSGYVLNINGLNIQAYKNNDEWIVKDKDIQEHSRLY